MFAKCWRGIERAVAMAVSRSTQVQCSRTNVTSVIHRADYQRILVEECERLGVDVRLKSELYDIDFDETTVTLKNGGKKLAGVIGREQFARPQSETSARKDILYCVEVASDTAPLSKQNK